jgi:hypothetical protein
MSYPPPPGLPTKPPQHASLPARPPPSTVSPAPAVPRPQNGGFKPAFTSFAPRSVAAAQSYRTASPAHYSAPPVTSYSSGPQTSYSSTPQYSAPQQDTYQAQTAPQYPGAESSYAQPTAPQIRNPFVPTSGTATSTNTQAAYDPELEAQIQQWQSAYMGGKDDKPSQSYASRSNPLGPTGANNAPLGASSRVETPTISASSNTQTANGSEKTVIRSGGGKEWTDSSLLEWDPAHFRIFVGNLAGEVTDESLLKAFAKYSSVQKARVIRDKRTTKSKGYGFVSFSDGDDYFQAARDMQGKYIGSHPVLIKRAQTEVKASGPPMHGKGRNGKGKGGGGSSGKTEHGGVQKKVPKMKGGLKVLG